MSSVSGSTSSLSNSLRGYGGMASGLDRDALIEQMTLGTVTKINNVKKNMTSKEWEQEAYRSLSDKIIDLQDNYFGYSATNSLTSYTTFAKSQVSTVGKSDVTQYVTATGTSSMVDYLSIQGVQRLATSAVCVSDKKGDAGTITTNISSSNWDSDTAASYSSLKGTNLTIGTYDKDGNFTQISKFTFPTTYKESVTENGTTKEVTKDIDYTTTDTAELVRQLNLALKDTEFGKSDNFDGYLQFSLGDDGSLSIVGNDKDGNSLNIPSGFVINASSSALSALGLDKSGLSDTSKGISIGTFNDNSTKFADSAIKNVSWLDYLDDKKLTFTYGGQTKEIDLSADDSVESIEDYKTLLQERINKAFGSGKIEVSTDGGVLSFATCVDPENPNYSNSLTIHSDDLALRDNLGISKNASNQISLDGTLADNFDKLGFGDLAELENALGEFTINGEKIEGLKSSMTINEMLQKINDTTGVGVKASYMSGSNQFVLVATETGSGRDIQLGGAAEKIFGCKGGTGYSKDGEDALIEVSYGNGLTTTIKSSSNTFNLEGLKVTVTGTFGYKTDENGKFKLEDGKPIKDSSQSVSFSAKADVDGVTETVKKFIEEYNTLIKEINTQLKTYPSGYDPLTDEQKDEMDDTTIEKWEKKAKEGLLFGSSTIRSLSSDMESIITQFMAQNGIATEQLEEIGISISDDYLDGGTLVFDENKFKEAMESDPESVSNVFAGGGDIKTGLTSIMEKTLTKYATRYASRNGNSYGLLIEEAGSEKIPTSVRNNRIYKELKDLQEQVDKLTKRKETEEDRYITMFTAMENAISNMNAQSSYLSSLQG